MLDENSRLRRARLVDTFFTAAVRALDDGSSEWGGHDAGEADTRDLDVTDDGSDEHDSDDP